MGKIIKAPRVFYIYTHKQGADVRYFRSLVSGIHGTSVTFIDAFLFETLEAAHDTAADLALKVDSGYNVCIGSMLLEVDPYFVPVVVK